MNKIKTFKIPKEFIENFNLSEVDKAEFIKKIASIIFKSKKTDVRIFSGMAPSKSLKKGDMLIVRW